MSILMAHKKHIASRLDSGTSRKFHARWAHSLRRRPMSTCRISWDKMSVRRESVFWHFSKRGGRDDISQLLMLLACEKTGFDVDDDWNVHCRRIGGPRLGGCGEEVGVTGSLA